MENRMISFRLDADTDKALLVIISYLQDEGILALATIQDAIEYSIVLTASDIEKDN